MCSQLCGCGRSRGDVDRLCSEIELKVAHSALERTARHQQVTSRINRNRLDVCQYTLAEMGRSGLANEEERRQIREQYRRLGEQNLAANNLAYDHFLLRYFHH
jgi:hypothetical protein